MPRKSKKSKSSKKKKTSKPPNLSSSKNANLSEVNNEKQFSDEGATASFQTKNYESKTSDESESRNVYFDDSNFEFNKTHSSPTDSKERSPSAFEKSESVKLFERLKWDESSISESAMSIRSKLSKSPARSESVQSHMRSKLVQRSAISELIESPVKSKSVESPVRSESIASPVTPKLVESRSESVKSSRSESVRTSILLQSDELSFNLDSIESFSSGSLISPRTKSAGPHVKSKSKSKLAKSVRELRKIFSEPILKSSLSDWEVNYPESEFSESPTRPESVPSPKRSELVLSLRSKLVKSTRSESVGSSRSESVGSSGSESVGSSGSESVGSSGSESIRSSLNSVESLRSVGTESAESPRTKSADPLVKSKPENLPLRKVFSEPILKSKLTDWAVELLFTQITKRRRPNFSHLFDTALNMVNYMEHLGTLRKADDNRISIVNNRWKQNDASDWFDLLNLWDNKVQYEIKKFMYKVECIYDDFNEDADISVTIPEYYGFIEDLEDILKSISLLLKRCTNCYHKYSRFCATSNESTFLKNVSNYRINITGFHKKIKIELDKFIALGDLTLRGQYRDL